MEKVRFGRTELMVSRIGMGGIPITRLSHDEAVALVKEALALGINFIDTAIGYTDSEVKIGAAIKGVPRDEIVLATKSPATDKATFLKHLDQSLMQLGVDYVDIYQLHNVTAFNRAAIYAPGGAFEGLLEAVTAGKVRFPAFSSHSVALATELMRGGAFDVVQLPFNYIDTEAIQEAIPLAEELDMGFIAMKPMGGGLLYDAGLSFRFLMQFDNVVPDPGVESIKELREIVEAVEAREPLSHADKAEIERLRGEFGDSWCHRCDYCQPCPQGVPISGALVSKSTLKRYPFEKAYSIHGGTIEKARDCIECSVCLSRCPYNLEIPTLLKEAIVYWEDFVAAHQG